MAMFGLDESKTPAQLSAGMRVKYALALGLSRNAELLILDEPTSGLDPVSRDDLLDVFLALRDEGITILFSTHITSDLDKCADNILYIKNGAIWAEGKADDFVKGYKVLSLDGEAPPELAPKLLGIKRTRDGVTALIRTEDLPGVNAGIPRSDADLEAIMVHIEKEGQSA